MLQHHSFQFKSNSSVQCAIILLNQNYLRNEISYNNCVTTKFVLNKFHIYGYK